MSFRVRRAAGPVSRDHNCKRRGVAAPTLRVILSPSIQITYNAALREESTYLHQPH